MRRARLVDYCIIGSFLLSLNGCVRDSINPSRDTLAPTTGIGTEEAIPGPPSGVIQERVVGGTFESDYKYPWVVHVAGTLSCGGVLIDPQWVLTAAHCVNVFSLSKTVNYRRTNPYTSAVEQDSRTSVPETGVFLHPRYVIGRSDNDIALIKLEKPFTITPYLQTVGLPRSPRQQGMVGTLAAPSHTGTPLPGQIAIFRGSIPSGLDGSTFSLYSPRDSTASLCPGDSGSGFVTVENSRATVRGIAREGSQSSDCMTPSGFNWFTDVFAYRDWILQTMGKNDASLAGTTRVRWSGIAARGVMAVECPASGTRIGPLNVVGVEEGALCESGQLRTVKCTLDPNQVAGKLPPSLSGITMRTTMANGATDSRFLSSTSNELRINSPFPLGAISQEFICQIVNPIAPTTPENTPILQRGVDREQPAVSTPESSSPSDPSGGGKTE